MKWKIKCDECCRNPGDQLWTTPPVLIGCWSIQISTFILYWKYFWYDYLIVFSNIKTFTSSDVSSANINIFKASCHVRRGRFGFGGDVLKRQH